MFFLEGITADCRRGKDRIRLLPAAALLLFTFLSASCDGGKGQAGREPPTITSLHAYGIVEARRHSTLSAKFPGKIERILVEEGVRVTEGQLLARFEAREFAAAARSAETAVAVAQATLAEAQAGSRPQERTEAEAQVSAAESRLAKAELDWGRAERLRSQGAMAAAEWEAARLARAEASASLDAARARLSLAMEGTREERLALLSEQLALARARLDEARAALANADLVAPFAGVMTRKHREEGEALDIGMPVMDVATLEDRYIRTEIDETDIGRLRPGLPATITADGFPGLEFSGAITAIKQQMGAKRLIPTDPAKIVDFKVLDVEVSLPANCPFPIKLPVNVRLSLEKKT